MSKTVMDAVLQHIQKGKFVSGLEKSGIEIGHKAISGHPTLLRTSSYNCSLTKDDFLGLVPDSFDPDSLTLFKKRDPKYFQFKDSYYLSFSNYNALDEFVHRSKLSRLHKTRVRFEPIYSNSMDESRILNIYKKYCRNLSNASKSSELYFQHLNDEVTTDSSLKDLYSNVKDIEGKSLVAWNIPNELSPTNIKNFFWFYDIKNCFKLYWNDSNNSSLYYFFFNNTEDPLKFAYNLHGTYFNDNRDHKLLIDKL